MATDLTHRERVMASLSHQQPDTIPIDLGGSAETSIVFEGYERLKNYFGVKSETKLCHRMMRVAEIDEQILKTLDIDVRAVFPGDLQGTEVFGPDRYRDGWGVERIHPEHSFYFDQESFPLSGDIMISDIVNYPWPDPDYPGIVQGLKNRVAWIRENTDCAAILSLPAPMVHYSQYLRGFEDWYIDLALHPKRIETLFDAVLEVVLQMTKNILKEVGQDVDVVITADDLGAQNGLQISYDHYLKFIKPRHKKYFELVHDLTPAKVLLHSCGSVVSIIDDLIELGVDALNPVQTTAAGMNPIDLKKKYKGKMAFWGAIDSQKTLPDGDIEDIKKLVEKRIEELGENGGYVLCAVHNIQPDVPLQNILTMYRHAREYIPSFVK
jgi:uroporphyrinogen decarboxylase